jgi:hypothetical protein
MRKLIAAGLAVLPLAVGCKSVGGECDCAPVPGDSVGHNPHVAYHATCPVGGASGVVAPAHQHISTPTTGDGFEPIGPPKMLPGLKK